MAPRMSKVSLTPTLKKTSAIQNHSPFRSANCAPSGSCSGLKRSACYTDSAFVHAWAHVSVARHCLTFDYCSGHLGLRLRGRMSDVLWSFDFYQRSECCYHDDFPVSLTRADLDLRETKCGNDGSCGKSQAAVAGTLIWTMMTLSGAVVFGLELST